VVTAVASAVGVVELLSVGVVIEELSEGVVAGAVEASSAMRPAPKNNDAIAIASIFFISSSINFWQHWLWTLQDSMQPFK
jgi:hypothetical protein